MPRPHYHGRTCRLAGLAAGSTATARRAVVALAVLAAAAALAACSSSSAAANASATLNRLRGMDVLVQPPTQGTLVGHGEDRGSNSSITGRNPGITSVFATPVFPRAVEAYYQSVYAKYHLNEDCCATANHIQLVGAGPNATVAIDIATGSAHIPDHYRIQQKTPPHGATTFVTVQVTATR